MSESAKNSENTWRGNDADFDSLRRLSPRIVGLSILSQRVFPQHPDVEPGPDGDITYHVRVLEMQEHSQVYLVGELLVELERVSAQVMAAALVETPAIVSGGDRLPDGDSLFLARWAEHALWDTAAGATRTLISSSNFQSPVKMPLFQAPDSVSIDRIDSADAESASN